MASSHLDHPVLKQIIEECKDEFQGYSAFNLYLRLCKQFKLDEVIWQYDSFLKMVILQSKHDGHLKVFLPLHFTYKPSPKWIREATAHIKEIKPEASFHLAFASSSQTFVIYRTNCGLELLKNLDCEELRKAKLDLEDIAP